MVANRTGTARARSTPRRPGGLARRWPARAAQYVVAMATTTSTAIGVSRRRSDGEGKVRGATRFAADVPVHGLLHARLVLAAEAHGRIAGIDGSAALAGGGGGGGCPPGAPAPAWTAPGAAPASRWRGRRSSTPVSRSPSWWPRPR